ncbi:hypothetical protein [Sphingobium sp. CFD-2]|uniref:hypothetical protein n=1 Tax=Sphingobium sp. CFD-2 TaxID=2878542 RepID=UPI00214C1EA8|nr:hypothetical protein [Sphingobium sp. CFD-2]
MRADSPEAWNRRSSPPQNDAGGDWICAGIPDEVIEAGCDAWDRARQEMEDREASDQPEAYRDWDDGMIVAAIFKAMSAALRTPMSELQALGQEFEAGESRQGMSACNKCGKQYPSAPLGYHHKCGECSGICHPLPSAPSGEV